MNTSLSYDYDLSSYPEFPPEEDWARHQCTTAAQLWFQESPEEVGSVCPPYWDRISCWPPTAAGTTAVIPCMAQLNGIFYDTNYNASLDCELDGMWANKSNYSRCQQIAPVDVEMSASAISTIYFCGHSLSLLALLVAFSICIYFKEMRCLRNKIHANLFLTYILANSCWILTAAMQDAHFQNTNVEFYYWCISLVFLRYFHLATFFWMFVEGLYLFVQVIATFSVENSKMKLRHYILIGWGIPLVVVVLWAILTYRRSMDMPPQDVVAGGGSDGAGCPFIEKSSTEWIYIVPVFFLLATNTFFLVSIFYVVVAKLRSARATRSGRGEADHQNWKAAKALLVIIPLLGITYLITILGPADRNTLSFVIFEHVRAVLLSTQGFTVTLPYCFLNTEVKGIVTHHWTRWRAARTVENNYSRGQSARNSISLAGYYACDSNITNLSNSRRNSFLRLHAQYLSSCTPHQTAESQLVTSVVLERGGLSSGRIIPLIQGNIPVIQEETDERMSITKISITPATPLTSPTEHQARTRPSEYQTRTSSTESQDRTSPMVNEAETSLPEHQSRTSPNGHQARTSPTEHQSRTSPMVHHQSETSPKENQVRTSPTEHQSRTNVGEYQARTSTTEHQSRTIIPSLPIETDNREELSSNPDEVSELLPENSFDEPQISTVPVSKPLSSISDVNNGTVNKSQYVGTPAPARSAANPVAVSSSTTPTTTVPSAYTNIISAPTANTSTVATSSRSPLLPSTSSTSAGPSRYSGQRPREYTPPASPSTFFKTSSATAESLNGSFP